MATQAHCAYCFESLAASLEKRPALSLHEVEALWAKYNTDPTITDALEDKSSLSPASADPSYKPAAISRILDSPSASASGTRSSSLQSGASTPSGTGSTSSATSQSSSQSNLVPKDAEDEEEQHPLFVAWNTVTKTGDHRLRGCIGTFSPLALSSGLSSYALTSAFDDTRFSPITAREFPSLEVGVTLLTNFEPAGDAMDWEVGTHGLRVSFTHKGKRYGSTYLPYVAKEQGWSKEEALVSLMRKAGWGGKEGEWRKVDLKVTRYQGKKVELGYGEWREWRDWVEEEMADC
ncbi:hypothetical protein EJ02DRAFT_450568 [Clathrospora elynae]|uniref:AMMECR1 domain-containing protein n=1 Tax=Clathrospora elynae TaxID=706981 RepID=A0A6A5TC24_9PLEO|nr:hypothetical protein EJ02DRAFT_450568 [Clathrospora elynae]